MRQPVVVDHDAELLAVAGAVHPGDGLQQLGFADRATQVHHPFNRRVEAGQEHRLDDEEGQRIPLGGVGMGQGLHGAPDALLMGCAVVQGLHAGPR